MINAPRFPRVARGLIAAISLLFSYATVADDELALYVFDSGSPAAGVEVMLDGEVAGVTQRDGSVTLDLTAGQHAVVVKSASGQSGSARFSAASGQLVDVIIDLSDGDAPFIDVFSRSESASDRKDAPSGTLQISVRKGAVAAPNQLVVISNGEAVATDSSGTATTQLRRGIYRLTIAEQTVEARVVGGVTRGVAVTLPDDGGIEIASPTLEEVFVVATFNPAGLEVSEREASGIVDTIGVELLTRFADSDVAASAVRVPGISVQDDKYVFIRGLGGRYVSSTLNNATMPSTNPSKRTVPLDLFPSNFVSQLDIKKTFLPSMPGESTGGNLIINTKTFPDERTGSVSIQLGYLDGVTGETVFIDPIDGDFDAIGWDDGSREEDVTVKAVAAILGMGRITDTNSGVSYELDPRTQGELQRMAGILIKDGFDADFENALPEGKLTASYGDLFYFDNGSELGFYSAVNYNNSWSQRDSGERYTYESEGEVADNFLYERYSNNVEISGLASVGLNVGDSTFEWNNVLSRVTESWVERVVGQEGDEFQALVGQTIQWEERTFASSQLIGSHLLTDDGRWFLEWQATGSFAYRYAPDRRDFNFTATQSATDPDGLKSAYDFSKPNDEQSALFNGFILEPGEITRRYDELADGNVDISFDLTWDVFDNGASFGQLKGGAQLIYRERDADSATYGYNVNQIRDDLVRSDDLLVSEVIYVCGTGPGTVACPDDGSGKPPQGGITNSPSTGLVFVDKTLASDSYEAELEYNSAYLMYDHTWNSVLQFVLGARYEMFEQTTETFSLQGEQEAVQAVIDEDSVLPSLGINWYFSESQQLRFAVSQTVARPDFKEAANATFYDNEFNFRVRGNPFLEISEVINADLRWEWYPSEESNLSVAAFYKDMDKPIERVVQPASGTAGNSRTFQNSDSAELYGVELEGRTEFVLSDDYSQTFFISLNAAFIESEVTSEGQQDRALQGQPEYTANFIIGYDNIERGHQLTLLLNQNGKAIADVGVSGQPDVFLEPRLDLNLVYRYDVTDALVLKAKLQNLLDEEYEYTQGGQIFQTYERGIGFQMSFDWTF